MNAKEFVDVVKSAAKEKTSAYDAPALVKRVEGDTLWVHIAGGTDETPVRRTINAKAGDTIQVRVSNGTAWVQGNESAPPTDDTTANAAQKTANNAEHLANTAAIAADKAVTAADAAEAEASRAKDAAEDAETAAGQAVTKADAASAAAATADQKATAAGTAAAAAQTSADNAASAAATADSKATAASAAASRAETSASTASQAASQAVTDAAAAQTAANNAGQAASRAQAAADAAQGEIESQQEYFWHDALGAHVLSDTDEVTGNRYRTDLKGAGQEIFELDGQNETSVASFGADGARLGETRGAHSVIDEDGQRFYAFDGKTQLANIGYGEGASESGTAVAPYYTFGVRKSGSAVGNYSVAEGTDVISSGYTSHAEGNNTTANGIASHAEGSGTTTTASGDYSHAEGINTEASGLYSHAGGHHTKATKTAQTVIGSYNEIDEETSWSNQKWFIIGNGISETRRSNAFSVSRNGNVKASGSITDGSGNVLSDKADSSSLPEIAKGRTASITAAANSYKDLTVSFGRTFSSVPRVVCSIFSTSKAGAIGSLTASALDVTTTGFKVRVFNAGSASRSPAVDWIAIN